MSRVLVAALLVVPALLAGCGTSRWSGDGEAGPDCGPTVEKADGTDWECVFSDDFAGDALDKKHWTVLSSLASGYRNGPECYLGDESPLGADDVVVARGVLRLTARALDHEVVCPSLSGDFPSRWTGAFVTTYGKYTTTLRPGRGASGVPRRGRPRSARGAVAVAAGPGLRLRDHRRDRPRASTSRQYPDRAVPFLHYHCRLVPDGVELSLPATAYPPAPCAPPSPLASTLRLVAVAAARGHRARQLQ